LLSSALDARAFSACTVEVGHGSGPVWQRAYGRTSFDPDAAPCTLDTVFDLASLTKVVATTALAMRHAARGTLPLDARVVNRLSNWRDLGADSAFADRARMTVRQLLDHSAGYPAHLDLWEYARGRDAIELAIRDTPLAHPPGTTAVYSDLGFMLLGFLLEDAGQAPLDRQIAAMPEVIAPGIVFTPPATWRPRTAATEIDRVTGQSLVGVVHDENARALGGVAGHAGLFGTAPDVGAHARLVLRTFRQDTPLGRPQQMREFARQSQLAGSSRALGWDTMRPTSSCGSKFSPTSIGHTGFTGTSLWIDWERDRYVVLLTNRVHPTRENDALVKLRPRVHDAIADAFV